ncbi:hypothetical protein HDU67_005555 [Dinochytrium kinnereticum]|nr:hypothetical protein HDU67_005555 [Dinochytrium kinnereticum]
MIFTKIVAIAALAATASAGLADKLSPKAVVVDNSYTFDLPLDVVAKDHVEAFFASRGVTPAQYRIRTNYQSPLVNMISVEFIKPIDENLLGEMPRAYDVSRVQYIARPKPFAATTEGTGKFAPETIHSITGVNDARSKLGLTGKGIKVAVIDSGIDYNHEALGGGFGPGYKVSFGWDLVGDAYSASSPPVQDSDPLDNCSADSHGTHVAGIVAADATNLTKPEWATSVPFTGVAPEATLGAYRVFSCDGGGTASDIIAEAIYRAAADGADIINLSLGGGPVYNDFVTSVAASRVSAAGALVISANGNSGAQGTFVGGSPGTAAGGLGIASFDNLNVPKAFVEVASTKFEYNIGGNNGNFNFGVDYDVVINNIEAEDKDILDDGLGPINPDAKGKALLIRWGGVASNGRCSAAARAGATACILYANTDSIPNIAGASAIPSLATSRAAGLALLAAAKAGQPLKLMVSDKLGLFDIPTAGTVSDFSSPGLDQELFIKPDLGGIGGEVYSTVSKASQTQSGSKAPYAVYGGTSMASPYVSGVAALLLQAYGRSKPTFDEFRTILQNTATFVNKYKTDMVDSVAYQGAGLVNAYAAITSKTLVYPSRLAFNDTRNVHQHYKMTVTNKGTTTLAYTVKHQPALMVTSFAKGDDANLNALDQTYTPDYASIKFSRNNQLVDSLDFTLKAGESRGFNVHVQPPTTATAGLFPIYSGYVVVDAEGEKVASVPYAGMVGAWRDAPIWVKKSAKYDGMLQAIGGSLGDLGIPPVANATLTTGVYALEDSWAKTVSANAVYNLTDAPLLVLPVAATTTRFSRVEAIYKGDWSVLSKVGLKRESQMHIVGATLDLNPDPFGAINVGGLGLATTNPVQRNSYSSDRPVAYIFNGQVLTNLTDPDAMLQVLPAGKYQIRFAALKHFGRINAPVGGTEFDTVYSNTFEIVY